METEQARQILANVEARHNEIIKLEKSLKEYHDLFLNMALSVESQGEVGDRIENHVTGTQAKAQEHLTQAEVLQTKARKKKIFIIIVLILLTLLLCLIIYFSLL